MSSSMNLETIALAALSELQRMSSTTKCGELSSSSNRDSDPTTTIQDEERCHLPNHDDVPGKDDFVSTRSSHESVHEVAVVDDNNNINGVGPTTTVTCIASSDSTTMMDTTVVVRNKMESSFTVPSSSSSSSEKAVTGPTPVSVESAVRSVSLDSLTDDHGGSIDNINYTTNLVATVGFSLALSLETAKETGEIGEGINVKNHNHEVVHSFLLPTLSGAQLGTGFSTVSADPAVAAIPTNYTNNHINTSHAQDLLLLSQQGEPDSDSQQQHPPTLNDAFNHILADPDTWLRSTENQFVTLPPVNIKQHIPTVLPDDVLCGRGGETNHHPGNVQYRSLVKAFQKLYIESKRRDKPKIAQCIVYTIRSVGGRFLKRTDPSVNGWVDVGNTKAREKTSQALREGAPDLRGNELPSSTSLDGQESTTASVDSGAEDNSDVVVGPTPSTTDIMMTTGGGQNPRRRHSKSNSSVSFGKTEIPSSKKSNKASMETQLLTNPTSSMTTSSLADSGTTTMTSTPSSSSLPATTGTTISEQVASTLLQNPLFHRLSPFQQQQVLMSEIASARQHEQQVQQHGYGGGAGAGLQQQHNHHHHLPPMGYPPAGGHSMVPGFSTASTLSFQQQQRQHHQSHEQHLGNGVGASGGGSNSVLPPSNLDVLYQEVLAAKLAVQTAVAVTSPKGTSSIGSGDSISPTNHLKRPAHSSTNTTTTPSSHISPFSTSLYLRGGGGGHGWTFNPNGSDIGAVTYPLPGGVGGGGGIGQHHQVHHLGSSSMITTPNVAKSAVAIVSDSDGSEGSSTLSSPSSYGTGGGGGPRLKRLKMRRLLEVPTASTKTGTKIMSSPPGV
jgi:hypothetical protein